MRAPSLSELTQTAKKALLTGGRILQLGFKQPHRVAFKSQGNPVTQIDVASEKAIIGIIRKKFPHHEFLAEEMSHRRKHLKRAKVQTYRWVIDPLDGTVNYVHRIPQSCVSVAVEYEGRVLAGGVYDPFQRELFLAARGQGATCNGKPIKVSPVTHLRDALLVTGFPYDHKSHAAQYLSLWEPFLKRCADLRRFGAAALDLAWVAAGRLECFWEYKLNPWDVAAGQLLVEEAGGQVSDFKGDPLNLEHPFETLATNGKIHSQIVQLLRRRKIRH